MNDEAYKPDSLEELPGDLRAAIERLKHRPVPEAAMHRALDRAARCGSLFRRTDHRLAQRVVLGFAAAVALCIALSFWFPPPSDSWADVVKAVQAKPWIHQIHRGANPDQSSESWMSTSRASGGSRSKYLISFFDDRVVYRYEPEKKILYRLPASTGELARGQQFLETFQALFRGDAELKTRSSGMILREQTRRQIKKDGRRWTEYELHFLVPSRPDVDVRMTFVVDAKTHLPHSVTRQTEGDPCEFLFDYPENGPADIYALGVPKDAKLVDRVPTGEMSLILAGIQVGQDGFDDFHAIVIEDGSPDSTPGRGQRMPVAYLVWKKGKRWRAEMGSTPSLADNRAPMNKDRAARVREACRRSSFTTLDVSDGNAVYRHVLPGQGPTWPGATRENNFELLTTADQPDSCCGQAMRAMPGKWCYPVTFPPPNDRTEDVVYPRPSEGPPNTIMVTSYLADTRGYGPDVSRISRYQRFWVDSSRGYAVVRRDTLHEDPALKPPTTHDWQYLMDEWKQTPKGIWYPTRAGMGSFLNGLKTGATWYHFYLDFKAEIPDDLFKPAKRTLLTDRYPVRS